MTSVQMALGPGHLFPPSSVDKWEVNHFKSVLALITLGSVLCTTLPAQADCGSNSPLLNEGLGHVSTLFFDQNWPLAIRPGSTVYTDALVELSFGKSSDTAHLNFSYNKPGYVGIPFTFQKVEVDWTDEDSAPHSSFLDWSKNCTGPGRSLWMNQSWSVDLPLPEQSLELFNVTLKLWGSEN